MNDVLCLLAVILPCWYAAKRSLFHGRIEVNHVTTLSFGFLFYWITPLAVRIFASRTDFPLAATWLSLFRERLVEPYALSCIALYLCFVLGDSLAIGWFPVKQMPTTAKVPRLALSLVAAATTALMLYSAFIFRAALFRAASPTDFQVGVARGAVTGCVVLLGVLVVMFTLDHPEMSWRERWLSPYYLAFVAGGLLMLSLGSRLYVASFLVMFVIYQTNFRSRYKLRTVVAAAAAFAFLFGAVGTLREGSGVSGAFFNVFEEPMLGSISLVHHLRYKGISWTNTPTQLANDFENLIPTVLMPNKFYVIKKPDAYRPLGGLHSFVSFDLNFGVLGSALFWFLWPVGFRYLKSRSSSTLFGAMYIMSSGWLTFTFFRDPFSISLVKAILQDSILAPIAIVIFGRFLYLACSPEATSGALLGTPQIEAT